jgi:hypothetical protein
MWRSQPNIRTSLDGTYFAAVIFPRKMSKNYGW